MDPLESVARASLTDTPKIASPDGLEEEENSHDCDLVTDQSSDSEDDLMSSRSRVKVDISHLVLAVQDEDEEEKDALSGATVGSEAQSAQRSVGANGIEEKAGGLLDRRGKQSLSCSIALTSQGGELLRITDNSDDIAKCLSLQDGVLTNRQRRWLKLEQDDELEALERLTSPLKARLRAVRYHGANVNNVRRRPIWIPLSIMVAGRTLLTHHGQRLSRLSSRPMCTFHVKCGTPFILQVPALAGPSDRLQPLSAHIRYLRSRPPIPILCFLHLALISVRPNGEAR